MKTIRLDWILVGLDQTKEGGHVYLDAFLLGLAFAGAMLLVFMLVIAVKSGDDHPVEETSPDSDPEMLRAEIETYEPAITKRG